MLHIIFHLDNKRTKEFSDSKGTEKKKERKKERRRRRERQRRKEERMAACWSALEDFQNLATEARRGSIVFF